MKGKRAIMKNKSINTEGKGKKDGNKHTIMRVK